MLRFPVGPGPEVELFGSIDVSSASIPSFMVEVNRTREIAAQVLPDQVLPDQVLPDQVLPQILPPPGRQAG